jgi:alcohol dehydrogenase class IV
MIPQALQHTGQHLRRNLDDIPELLETLSASRVLLVLDRAAVHAAGITSALEQLLAHVKYCEFDRFSPNPKSEQALEAAHAASNFGVEAVIAIGGGSCMDVAKVAAMAARTPLHAEALSKGESTSVADPIPLIAVPTTSGTGSEATHFAAVYNAGRKVSIAHPRIRPWGVVLDAALHIAMPARLAAICGLDALGQAIESLWAVGSTSPSREYALLGGKLIADNISQSVTHASPHAREQMMIGAHLAGQAINISKTTASHALSYELTQRFGVPHGLGVALTLGHVAAANDMVTNSTCADPRGVDHVKLQVTLGAQLLNATPQQMPNVIETLLQNLGLPSTLQKTGVPAEALPSLALAVDPLRLSNNPRTMTTPELESLLQCAHAGVLNTNL